MSGDYSVVTQSMVLVKVSSNATSFLSERKIPKDMKIIELKNKLELQTGCSAAHMKLEIYDKHDQVVCKLDDNEAIFGSFPVDDDMRLHVTDPSKKLGEYEDVSKVEKYDMPEDEYAKRTDSVRAFKQRMKMGRFADQDPEELKKKEEERKLREQKEQDMAGTMKVGDRCEITVTGNPTRRGEVKYVGTTDFKDGLWVGVKYDEPHGKNDGSVQGRRYFECPPKYGGFVRVENVKVGDFPEEGFSDEDMDEL